jgi:hypothetical protein
VCPVCIEEFLYFFKERERGNSYAMETPVKSYDETRRELLRSALAPVTPEMVLERAGIELELNLNVLMIPLIHDIEKGLYRRLGERELFPQSENLVVYFESKHEGRGVPPIPPPEGIEYGLDYIYERDAVKDYRSLTFGVIFLFMNELFSIAEPFPPSDQRTIYLQVFSMYGAHSSRFKKAADRLLEETMLGTGEALMAGAPLEQLTRIWRELAFIVMTREMINFIVSFADPNEEFHEKLPRALRKVITRRKKTIEEKKRESIETPRKRRLVAAIRERTNTIRHATFSRDYLLSDHNRDINMLLKVLEEKWGEGKPEEPSALKDKATVEFTRSLLRQLLDTDIHKDIMGSIGIMATVSGKRGRGRRRGRRRSIRMVEVELLNPTQPIREQLTGESETFNREFGEFLDTFDELYVWIIGRRLFLSTITDTDTREDIKGKIDGLHRKFKNVERRFLFEEVAIKANLAKGEVWIKEMEEFLNVVGFFSSTDLKRLVGEISQKVVHVDVHKFSGEEIHILYEELEELFDRVGRNVDIYTLAWFTDMYIRSLILDDFAVEFVNLKEINKKIQKLRALKLRAETTDPDSEEAKNELSREVGGVEHLWWETSDLFLRDATNIALAEQKGVRNVIMFVGNAHYETTSEILEKNKTGWKITQMEAGPLQRTLRRIEDPEERSNVYFSAVKHKIVEFQNIPAFNTPLERVRVLPAREETDRPSPLVLSVTPVKGTRPRRTGGGSAGRLELPEEEELEPVVLSEEHVSERLQHSEHEEVTEDREVAEDPEDPESEDGSIGGDDILYF